jgi:dCMP deaminase
MELAESMSKRSTCKRLQVGTVITTTDFRKVLAVGYNGNASGLRNTCDSDTVGACLDLHAEENAIINCDCPRYVEKYVFATHNPCIMCAKRLINLGNVKKVYYKNEYRDTTPIDLLNSVGIETVKM